VKEIACAGCVGDADLVGGRIPETMAIPSESTVDTERRTNSAAAVGSFEKRKGSEKVAFAGSCQGKISGGYWIIYEGEKPGELRRPVIEVGDHRDVLRAGPGCCLAGGQRIVAVDVKKARGIHPASLEKRGGDGEARISAPGHGAFARLSFHKNEGHLTERFGRTGEVESDAFAAKLAAMEFCRMVATDGADVTGAQPPALAGDDRGSDLAAEQDLCAESFDLRAERGELGHLQEGVGCVFADSEDVEFL